jgi:hypothetical protein
MRAHVERTVPAFAGTVQVAGDAGAAAVGDDGGAVRARPAQQLAHVGGAFREGHAVGRRSMRP